MFDESEFLVYKVGGELLNLIINRLNNSKKFQNYKNG